MVPLGRIGMELTPSNLSPTAPQFVPKPPGSDSGIYENLPLPRPLSPTPDRSNSAGKNKPWIPIQDQRRLSETLKRVRLDILRQQQKRLQEENGVSNPPQGASAMENPMDEGLTEPPLENFPPLRMSGERNPQGESRITPLDNLPPLRPTMSTDISPNSERPEDIYVDMSRPPPNFTGNERAATSKDYPPPEAWSTLASHTTLSAVRRKTSHHANHKNPSSHHRKCLDPSL